jgi:hypothetical protein
MVSIAKSTSTNAFIYPEINNITTMPHDLHSAVEHALRIISWQENLSSDEMPPRWMWNLDWEIDAHFERVDSARKTKYGITDSSVEEDDNTMWEENVYSARFKD